MFKPSSTSHITNESKQLHQRNLTNIILNKFPFAAFLLKKKIKGEFYLRNFSFPLQCECDHLNKICFQQVKVWGHILKIVINYFPFHYSKGRTLISKTLCGDSNRLDYTEKVLVIL